MRPAPTTGIQRRTRRGLALVRGDDDVLALTAPLFDGLYALLRSRASLPSP